ncbi:MAG TPA: ABC transporter ATP-binding protein [Pseudonocardia sp.]|nr:ABC transporter ATP-binding protein [Pseudonocardia sp.]
MSPARRSGGTICTRPDPPDDQPTPSAGRGPCLPGPPAARVRGLRKVYRRTVALDSVDLDVPAGSVLGLLGPNGSGKTTMLRLLLGLSRPSGGTVELLGQPMPRAAGRALPHVGALVEEPGFLPHLSGRDNLTRCAAGEPLLATAAIPDAVDGALRRVGLAGTDRPYRAYSLGLKQRLGLAAVLLAPRKLVVLDEPSNGLDPAGTREVRQLIADLHAAGSTVLLSSHLLSEVEETCTHVAVLTTGSVVATGELAELLEADGPALQIHTSQPNAALAALRHARIPGYTERGLVVVDLSDTPPELVLSTLVRAGVPVAEARRRRTGLEELFVQLTEDGA